MLKRMIVLLLCLITVLGLAVPHVQASSTTDDIYVEEGSVVSTPDESPEEETEASDNVEIYGTSVEALPKLGENPEQLFLCDISVQNEDSDDWQPEGDSVYMKLKIPGLQLHKYTINGMTDIKISALMDELRMPLYVADVAEVAFSDETLVSVTRLEEEQDWLLTSLQPVASSPRNPFRIWLRLLPFKVPQKNNILVHKEGVERIEK